MNRLIVVIALLIVSACGGNSPTAPTVPTPTASRIIALSGNLNFGNVPVGTTRPDGLLFITNSGNAVLTVTGLTEPAGMGYTGSWLSGTIAPGATQTVNVTFSPTAAQSYSGTITVNGNQTSGTNTIAVTGVGSVDNLPLFIKGGAGNTVFDMPTYIRRIRITADYGDYCQNFAVRVAGVLLVNEILGKCSVATTGTHYDGILLTVGGVSEVFDASGVHWLFTEVR